MNSQDFNALRHQEPFQPFRVMTTDGREIDVVHPQLVLTLNKYVWIGIPRPGHDKPIYQRLENVNYADITKIEMLPSDRALPVK